MEKNLLIEQANSSQSLLSIGDIITLAAIVVGFVFQYVSFSNKFSHFEGYTKAKLESFEKAINTLWAITRGVKHEE